MLCLITGELDTILEKKMAQNKVQKLKPTSGDSKCFGYLVFTDHFLVLVYSQ